MGHRHKQFYSDQVILICGEVLEESLSEAAAFKSALRLAAHQSNLEAFNTNLW